MLSAARCSSRRSNRSTSAEGRWRSRASAAGVEFDMIDFLLRSQAADWRGFDEIQLNNGGAKTRAEFATGP